MGGHLSAQELDAQDGLRNFRNEFHLPVASATGADLLGSSGVDEPITYLVGNSLGLLSKRSQQLINEELSVWATRAVEGHFNHPKHREWLSITDKLRPTLAELVGAYENEVACMGTLTANLHLLMNSFYKPSKERYKIICEAKAFPSDQYAIKSQIASHGFNPVEALIEISPRQREHILHEADILAGIEEHGDTTAVVLFPAVQYYTGQWFPMEKITRIAKAKGCIVGFDLAHGIGNVPMKLHDWGVDFAVWCSYKYLNSGPGGIGGLFVHSKWETDYPPKYHGWWGHDPKTRFKMPPDFVGVPGAAGFQQSNPSGLLAAALLGSLQLFAEAGGITALRAKSIRLTGYLESLLVQSKHFVPSERISLNNEERKKTGFTIITPQNSDERGAQLSLLWPSGEGMMQRVFTGMRSRGVLGDERNPDVIRFSPVPLYNSFADCERAARVLEEVLDLAEAPFK
ncbi:uncharacterized protein EI90DRAFT_3121423 [Cantharellus anzutake]|uniref:uncharacterized protein n=1 Tax=Cantharellus anzutake TaxID=1750568 RepID=UPI001905AD5A|nr:uncharacterized protein EI90DRAFT_3121423 [Cantharellus anzutake]KAF8334063.1 hypothetical protein EI90DRAFT_3121423 [Cantharellus anzutake]